MCAMQQTRWDVINFNFQKQQFLGHCDVSLAVDISPTYHAGHMTDAKGRKPVWKGTETQCQRGIDAM